MIDFPFFTSGELEIGSHSLQVEITNVGLTTPYVLDCVMMYSPIIFTNDLSGPETATTTTSMDTHTSAAASETSGTSTGSRESNLIPSLKPFVWPVVGALAALDAMYLLCLLLALYELRRAHAATRSAKRNTGELHTESYF